MSTINVADNDTLDALHGILQNTKTGLTDLSNRPMSYSFTHQIPREFQHNFIWNPFYNSPVVSPTTAVLYGDEVFAFGNTYNFRVYAYSFKTGVWDRKNDAPVSLANSQAVVGFDGYPYQKAIYVATTAGPSSAPWEFYKYVPETDTWIKLANQLFSPQNSAVGVYKESNIYIMGGSEYSNNNMIGIYNITVYTWDWKMFPSGTWGRIGAAMGGIIGDYFYIITSGINSVMVKYNLLDGTTTTGLPVPPVTNLNRGAHGVINGKLVCACGDTTDPTRSWIYDPVANSWSSSGIPNSTSSLANSVGAVVGDSMFIINSAGYFYMLKQMTEVLAAQTVGEVKQGQSIFYQTYDVAGHLSLGGDTLPEGASTASKDGLLVSTIDSGFGILRGRVG